MAMTRRVFLGTSAAGFAAAPLRAGAGPTTVELFTSQGCSSCPPADRLLTRLAARPDLLVLSWHVDYWDRLGWKDPYSLAEATARQRDYGQRMRLRTIYTPQIVIDGRREMVGSDERAVNAALSAAKPAPEAALALDKLAEGLRVRAVANDAVRLRRVDFLPRAATRVLRGENSGRDLAHVNIVLRTAVSRIGDGGTLDAVWTRDPALGTAALIEAEDGRILAAASVAAG
jgi:hypothetical protein